MAWTAAVNPGLSEVLVAPVGGAVPRRVTLPQPDLDDPIGLAWSGSGRYLLITGVNALRGDSEQDEIEWLYDTTSGQVTALPPSPFYEGFNGDSLYAVSANGQGGGTITTRIPGPASTRSVSYAFPKGTALAAGQVAGPTGSEALEVGDQGELTAAQTAAHQLGVYVVRPTGQAVGVVARDQTLDNGLVVFRPTAMGELGLIGPDSGHAVLESGGRAYLVDLTSGVTEEISLPGAPSTGDAVAHTEYAQRVRYLRLWVDGGHVEAAVYVAPSEACANSAEDDPRCTIAVDQVNEYRLVNEAWKATGRHDDLSADDGAISATPRAPFVTAAGPTYVVTRDGTVLTSDASKVAIAGVATTAPSGGP